MKTVAIAGTFDSKSLEFGYLQEIIQSLGLKTFMIHTGVFESKLETDVSNKDIARVVGEDIEKIAAKKDRALATDVLSRGLKKLLPKLYAEGKFDGIMEIFLKQLKEQGFAGVQNFPTVGLIDGVFRQNLEETGMGYDLEVEMIQKAHELDMVTSPYVFDTEQAIKMAKAGADILVAHMGLTTKGTIGAHTALTLDDCVAKVQAICDAGKAVNPDIIILCHGGPIAEPEDAQYIISNTHDVEGFFGASSIERFATEVGIKQQTMAFKAMKK